MKYILAGSYQQAKYVAKTLKLEPREYVLIGNNSVDSSRDVLHDESADRCGGLS